MPRRRRRRGLGHVAVVGHGADRRQRRSAARRDHLDGLARRRRRSSARVGGRVRVQGYDPRKLRRGSGSPAACPSRSGKDPIAHILWLQARRSPRSRARRGSTSSRRTGSTSSSPGGAAATFDSIVLHWVTDNRDLDARRLRRRAARGSFGVDRAQLPDLVPADRRCSAPLQRDVAPTSSGSPPGIPVVGGTPDVQSAAIGSGAVRDFEGHLYIGTSSWLTCHVPFKKTDILREHRVAAVAAAGQVLRGRRAGDRPARASTGSRDNVLFPDDALRADAGARRRLRALDDARRDARPPGSHGVIFTPWLNGERTPGRRPPPARRLAQPVAARRRAPTSCASVLEGVAFNSRWLLDVRREVHRAAVRRR